MEDISDLSSVATSPQQTAAENISHGNLFSVDPRFAAQNKSDFDEKAKALLAPQKAEPPVADYMRQSSEHAALAAPDVDHLNFIARQQKMIGDYVFNKPTVQQQIVDLNLKKMNQGGTLSNDDDIKLTALNQDAQDLDKKDYGISSPIEKVPAWIAGTLSDLGTSMVRGARKGIFESDIHLRGIPGLLGKAYYGTMVKDPFDQLTAGTYNELSNLTDENGNPKNLDHETKANIARGVGVVGTALMNVGGLAIAEASPFLKPLMNPVLAKGLITNPTRAAILTSIGGIMKGAAAMGGVNALTEVTRIIGEEIAQNHGTSEEGFWNALKTASDKLDKYAPRVGQATAQGLAFGALLETPLQIAGFGRTKQSFAQGFKNYVENLPPERDVTPAAPPQLEGAKPEVPNSVIDITPNEPPSGHDPIDGAHKVLQFNEALHQINDVQKATGMNEISPGELDEIHKFGFGQAGFKKLFSTLGDLKNWATSEEKGKAARDIIDPSGVASGQMNASIELDPHAIMKIAKQYPDILDHVTYDPSEPVGTKAKELVEAWHRAEEQRQEVMQKLGIKPSEVQPEQGDLGSQSVATLPTKEKGPAPSPDFEASVRRTGEILEKIKQHDAIIDQGNKYQEGLDKGYTEVEGGKKQILSKEDRAIAEEFAAEVQKELDERKADKKKLEKELEELKGKVTEQLKEKPPGSLLMFPFDEAKSAQQAEMKFGREPTFSEALRSVLPEKQVAAFDEAVLRARQNTVNMVHDQAVHEMNKVIDQTAEMAKEDQFRQELERIQHDPNYATVDKFRRYQIANSKGQAKRSMYAIDPTTLPKDLVHLVDNPRLKSHKVFAKGGMTADDSAKALGYASGRDLLDVLAKTPTREEVIKARAKAYDSDIEQLARQSVDLDHTSIVKAFTDKTKAYLETMRYLKDTDWSKTKFGIKKIALPLPKIEEIEHDAREAVKQMPVGSLRASKYVVGERQSYRNAVDQFLRGDIAGAFHQKELAARNSAMQAEVKKAISAVNRAQKFARRLEDPSAQAIMQQAGPRAQKAMDEILDVFNLNPNKKNQSEKDSYVKWVKRELEQGRGNFTIPERLNDVRKGIGDMTVEQVLVAEDRLRAIFKEAQYKTELMDSQERAADQRNLDRIAADIKNLEESHPATSEKNIKPVQETQRLGQKLLFGFQTKLSTMANMEHTLRFYDKGEFNGYMQQLIMHPLKGDGKWNYKAGVSKEGRMTEALAHNAREIFKNHGNYDAIERNFLYIPEFKDIIGLNHGHLTKGDLMAAWGYKGDPDGRKYLLENFVDRDGNGLTLETWEKVLDRELEERDVTAHQYSIDMFKNYQQETADLQLRDKGEQVVFIKGIRNKWRDKDFPGGYVPINFREDLTKEAIDSQLKELEGRAAAFHKGNVDIAELSKQRAAEQTEQGRLKMRTGGSKSPLDLSIMRFWRNHEEHIEDLSYREVVKDSLKVLRDPRIKESLIKIGGEAKYNLVVNSVIEMAGRIQAENANYFSDQNRFFKSLFGHLQSNFTVGVLAGNLWTSTPIQYESLAQVMQNMGIVSGREHLARINRKLVRYPHLFAGYLDFAKELDPTIGHFLDSLQNELTSTIHSMVPNKSWQSHVPGLKKTTAIVGATHTFLTSVAMSPMSLADVHLKMMAALASYSQFMAGESDNYPLEKVMAMPEDERHEAATAYVRQISRLSLTHGRPEDRAPFQKNPLGYFFANYWNDARNVLNNQIQQTQKVKWEIGKGSKALGSGGGGFGGGGEGAKGPFGVGSGGEGGEGGSESKQHGKAAGHFGKAAGLAMTLFALSTIARWYSDHLRGIQQTPDQWNIDLKSAKGIKDFSDRMLKYAMFSPVDQFLTVEGIGRETFFAEQMPDKVTRGYVDKTKTVQLPITKALSDIATAGNSLSDAYDQAQTFSDFLWYITNLDNKETKALLNAAGDLFGGAPINAYSRLMRDLEVPLNSPSRIGPAILDKLDGQIGHILKRSQSNGPDHLDLHADNAKELQELHAKLQPEVVEVPDGIYNKIKAAMSGGDWSKPDGIYGFTKDQWAEVKMANPQLGLTEAGRTSKNTEQQEKAMDFLLHYNAEKLADAGVKVNNESLFGAYRLGLEDYEKVYKASRGDKLKNVLSEETLKANPDFENIKTVGQLKNKLVEEMSKGGPKKTAQLTETTPNAEDKL